MSIKSILEDTFPGIVIIKLFFRVCNGLVPMSLPDYIIVRNNTRAATLCNGTIYGIDSSINSSLQKVVFSHSFFPRCVSHWNYLPPEIRASETLAGFLSSLEKYIWDKVLESSSIDVESEPD